MKRRRRQLNPSSSYGLAIGSPMPPACCINRATCSASRKGKPWAISELARPTRSHNNMVTEATFSMLAREAGFTRDQIEFLLEYVSHPGHLHTADQIVDLDDALTEILDDELE